MQRASPMGVAQSFKHIDTQAKAPNGRPGMAEGDGSMEYQLKEYLLLLATLVATVTYAAGLNLPGGSWLKDTPAGEPGGHVAGDSILRQTNYMRYIVFYYFNAISFAASLLVGLLLLLLQKGGQRWHGVRLLSVVRTVMVSDLLGLMGAYAVGGSHDRFTTTTASVLVSVVFAYVAVAFLIYIGHLLLGRDMPHGSDDGNLGEHEMLMVLAIFAATITYVAGLNPPGGFWRSDDEEGQHTAGDPVLQRLHPNRYKAFFFCNTVAFVASLPAIMVIVDYKKLGLKTGIRAIKNYALYGLIVTALSGLVGAYAAGSCRDAKHTGYVVLLVVPVAFCIFLQYVIAGHIMKLTCIVNIKDRLPSPCIPDKFNPIRALGKIVTEHSIGEDLKRARESIQLLATLGATIAYTAGLDPPGGVWAESGVSEESGVHHNAGDPILLSTHPRRYKAFFYFNSAAFVASLVIMVMLQSERLARSHALKAAMILDLFGLIGAYAAGSCRDTNTSIYTVALAGGVLIYVVIHIVFFTPESKGRNDEEQLEEKRKILLLLAILAATLTYQAGLTPPGGFWEEGDRAGFPVLHDRFPRRYMAFFYCNGASFMASVALIILLLNANMYKPGIRCYALVVCMVAGMVGLMCAYAAGSSIHLRTSIIVLVLLAAVSAILVILAIKLCVDKLTRSANKDSSSPKPNNNPSSDPELRPNNAGSDREKEAAMYLMLVGILAASVTYLTGLKPPGGLWREDDRNGHYSAGNPVLFDINKLRYSAFFYCNSASFVASITIIALLLSRMTVLADKLHLGPMHTAMVLDMFALLGAYAAGSDRESRRSWKVILLVPVVVLVVCLFWYICGQKTGDGKPEQPKTKVALITGTIQ